MAEDTMGDKCLAPAFDHFTFQYKLIANTASFPCKWFLAFGENTQVAGLTAHSVHGRYHHSTYVWTTLFPVFGKSHFHCAGLMYQLREMLL